MISCICQSKLHLRINILVIGCQVIKKNFSNNSQACFLLKQEKSSLQKKQPFGDLRKSFHFSSWYPDNCPRGKLFPGQGLGLGQGQGQLQGWGQPDDCPRGKLPPGQCQGLGQGQFWGWGQFSSGATILEPLSMIFSQKYTLLKTNDVVYNSTSKRGGTQIFKTLIRCIAR